MARGTGFNLLAQNVFATKGLLTDNLKMKHKKKMCWQCQKESVFEQGALLRITGAVCKYICKTCMDAKHTKQETKAEST
jgi:hypothetical protein